MNDDDHPDDAELEAAGYLTKAAQAGSPRCPRTGAFKRSCECASCRGARNRRKGRRKQRDAQKGLGVPTSKFASQMGHEENWRGALRAEVKAGKQVGPIATRFRDARDQSEASRPVGDIRPFAMVAMPDGTSDGIFLCRLSDLRAVVEALTSDGPEGR